MTLNEALRRAKLSDKEAAALAGLHRTQVWAYRRGDHVPGAQNALRLLEALRRRGVELSLADLVRRRRAA